MALGARLLARSAPPLPLLPLFPLATPELVPAVLFLGWEGGAEGLLDEVAAVGVVTVANVVLGAEHPPLEGLHPVQRRDLSQHPRVGGQPAEIVTLGLYPPRLPVTVQSEVQRFLGRRPFRRAVRVVVVLLQGLVEHAIVRVLALQHNHLGFRLASSSFFFFTFFFRETFAFYGSARRPMGSTNFDTCNYLETSFFDSSDRPY